MLAINTLKFRPNLHLQKGSKMLKFLFVLCVKHEDFIVQTKTNSNQ